MATHGKDTRAHRSTARARGVGGQLNAGAHSVHRADPEPILVGFRLPGRVQTKGQGGQRAVVETDALPGRKFMAVVQAVDPLVDANGRSVGVRGCIDNRQSQLRPGMFARVNTVFGVKEAARVIPEEAIVPQGGKQFVVKLLNAAESGSTTRLTQRAEVKLGLRRPGKVGIPEGPAPGAASANGRRIRQGALAGREHHWAVQVSRKKSKGRQD